MNSARKTHWVLRVSTSKMQSVCSVFENTATSREAQSERKSGLSFQKWEAEIHTQNWVLGCTAAVDCPLAGNQSNQPKIGTCQHCYTGEEYQPSLFQWCHYLEMTSEILLSKSQGKSKDHGQFPCYQPPITALPAHILGCASKTVDSGEDKNMAHFCPINCSKKSLYQKCFKFLSRLLLLIWLVTSVPGHWGNLQALVPPVGFPRTSVHLPRDPCFGSAMPHPSRISALSPARAGSSTVGTDLLGLLLPKSVGNFCCPWDGTPQGSQSALVFPQHPTPQPSHEAAPLLLHPTKHLFFSITLNEEKREQPSLTWT